MASAPLEHYGTPPVAVSFGKLPARTALNLQRLIAKAIGVAGPKISVDTGDLGVGMAIFGAIGCLSTEEFWEVAEALLATLTWGGKLFNLDTYEGSQLDLDKMLARAMEVNYPDFFALFKARFRKGARSPGNASPTDPATSPSQP